MNNQQPQDTQYNESNVNAAADVGKSLIQGIQPAEKGWILGFICVVAIIVLSDAWINLATIKASTANSMETRMYFEQVEQNRATSNREMLDVYAEQVRRSQEVIKALAQSVARDSERAGDAALFAIQKQSESLSTSQEKLEDELIGPKRPEQ